MQYLVIFKICIFEKPKIEYVLRSLNSLIKSIKYLNKYKNNLNVKLKIIDDESIEENIKKIKLLLDKGNVNYELINHDCNLHKDIIKKLFGDLEYGGYNIHSYINDVSNSMYTIADYRRYFNDFYSQFVDVLMWGETDALLPKQTPQSSIAALPPLHTPQSSNSASPPQTP